VVEWLLLVVSSECLYAWWTFLTEAWTKESYEAHGTIAFLPYSSHVCLVWCRIGAVQEWEALSVASSENEDIRLTDFLSHDFGFGSAIFDKANDAFLVNFLWPWS
jgi:hypothetical protein